MKILVPLFFSRRLSIFGACIIDFKLLNIEFRNDKLSPAIDYSIGRTSQNYVCAP